MENESMSLQDVVSSVLGHPYYEDLLLFFKSIFEQKDKIIVFVTRRCSCIGYIFLQILEYDNRDAFFLTDSALVDSGFFIGTQLRNGYVPEILMIDDSIAYGRATRCIIEDFLQRVTDGFNAAGGDENTEDYLSPLKYVQTKVRVSVFARKQQRMVLPTFYHKPVSCEKCYDDMEWNEFSNRLSELVNVTNIANAAFVMSAGADAEVCDISESFKITCKTDYRGMLQQVWFMDIPDDAPTTAVCSVRRVQCGVENRYRYIPLVFLPTLNEDNLRALFDDIFARIESNGDNVICKASRELRRLCEHVSMRKQMEFITMYLSHSTLLLFAEEFRLSFEEESFDSGKIAWNYTTISEPHGTAYNFLKLLCNPQYRNCMLSRDELYSWLEGLPNLGIDRLTFYKFDEYEHKQLRDALENQLFTLGMQAEILAHNCIVQNVSPRENTLNSLNTVRNNSLFEFVNDFYKNQNTCISYLLAYVLQMMDCGAMSVVISGGCNEMAQQFRICEQSQFLLIRRYGHCMDMLRDLDRYSNYPINKKNAQVRHFVKCLHDLDKNAEEDSEELCFLLRVVRDAAQSMDDWDIRLYRHFIISEKTHVADWDFEEEERQKVRREEYKILWRNSLESYN